MKNLLILGATGAVGGAILRHALANSEVAKITAPSRRPIDAHPKLVNPLVDYGQLPASAEWWQADAMLCCLGTTLQQAGSIAEFYKIDHDYVLAAAKLTKQAGTPCCVYNSSIGANRFAPSYYLKSKGKLEAALQTLDFASLTLVRPSILDVVDRHPPRPAELFSLKIMKAIPWLLPKRWRPVSIDLLAQLMLHAALAAKEGVDVVESERLQNK